MQEALIKINDIEQSGLAELTNEKLLEVSGGHAPDKDSTIGHDVGYLVGSAIDWLI